MAKIEQCMKCRKCDNFYGCAHYEKADDTECEYYEFPINNSKWSFIRLFSFKGRIRRAEMWLTYLGCVSAAFLINLYFIKKISFLLSDIFDQWAFALDIMCPIYKTFS